MLWSVDHFVSLEDFLLPSPLAALVAVLVVAGFVTGAVALRKRLFPDDASPVLVAGSLLVLLSGAGALLHGLAWAHLNALAPLRLVAWAIGGVGVFGLVRLTREVRARWASWQADLRALGWLDRALLVIPGASLALTFVACLAPAADSDSLDYHLGLPVEWLRHGIVPHPEWWDARHGALGESLNMLGLAAGTDRLGAVFQWVGILVAMAALFEVAGTSAQRRLVPALLAGVPRIVSLAEAQKWLVFPAAAIVLAAVLVLRGGDRRRLSLAAVALVFAVGCKTPFLAGAGAVVLVALWVLRSPRPIAVLLGSGVAAALVVLGPFWWRKFLTYGDPLSPALEQLLHARPDPVVVACKEYLQNSGFPKTVAGFSRFLVSGFVPLSGVGIGEVLGLGLLGFPLGWRDPKVGRGLVVVGLLAALFTLSAAEVSTRYVLDAYLCGAAALVAVGLGRLRTVVAWGMVGVSSVALAVATFSAALLAPGAISDRAREVVMRRSASEYNDARWLDEVVPEGASVFPNLRSYALIPRDFAASRGCAEALPDPSLAQCVAYRSLSFHPVDYFVRMTPSNPVSELAPLFSESTGKRGVITPTQRNPFHVGTATYELELMKIDPGRLDVARAEFLRAHPWCTLF